MTGDHAAKLARLLLENWEKMPPTPFPTEEEHRAASTALGLWSSDPDTWSAERRRYLRRDLERRLRAKRTSIPDIRSPGTKPLAVPARRVVDASVEAAS